MRSDLQLRMITHDKEAVAIQQPPEESRTVKYWRPAGQDVSYAPPLACFPWSLASLFAEQQLVTRTRVLPGPGLPQRNAARTPLSHTTSLLDPLCKLESILESGNLTKDQRAPLSLFHSTCMAACNFSEVGQSLIEGGGGGTTSPGPARESQKGCQ